jgi:hypothetical protein
MRIPPAVAREIGQMYASAHVNDAAATKLTESSKLLNGAADLVSRQDFGAALHDASTAVGLLLAVAGLTETGLSPKATQLAQSTLTSAASAIEALGTQRPDAAVTAFGDASGFARDGAASATDAAADWRYSADQLSREYL